ncbi:MAG: nicotinate (nicotinamide) nucleotide adenylyltransferase [Campylobacterales bacterium]
MPSTEHRGVALFGGSFDPPHRGHLEVVRQGLELLPVERVIVVPAFQNPLKGGVSAPPPFRLRWLRKIFAEDPRVQISDWEIGQQRPVYWIETLSHFRKIYREGPLYWIIGSDNLKNLEKWYRWRELLELGELVVATRGEVDPRLLEKYQVKYLLPVQVPISSTRIRGGEFREIPIEILEEIKEFYGVEEGSQN